jgi:hypothetical protein
MNLSSLSFLYDPQGFGDLVLHVGDRIADRLKCRTGSRDADGALVHALPIGNYALTDRSVATTEDGMYIGDAAQGWKIRLWLAHSDGTFEFTHFLIHPDGGLPGSLGCVGIQGSNAISFRHELDAAVRAQGVVQVTVGLLMRGVA